MRFGIDLGGTKIELIALDGSRVVRRRRVATPAHDYTAIVEAIAQLVEGAEHELGARGSVGVGTPGALSRRTQLMKNSNTQALNGRPLDRDLSERLGREVRIHNDANCFALSEAADGAAAGAPVVFGVILGTGVGGGVVVRGEAMLGRNAIAGEWGHNALPWPSAADEPAAECYCGRRGCIETYLSGPGFSRDHQLRTSQTLAAAEIVRAADGGSADEAEAARASIERYCERLARALASVINVLDPDAIVLGGGVSQLPQLYQRVPELWPRWVFSDSIETRLVPAMHGDSSGVRGAAWLWPAP